MAVRRSLAARRPPPTASAFAWRLGFCDSPLKGGVIAWERGRPARMLLLMVVAELPRGFAGSHYVGSNHNGQAEGEPGRRCRSIRVAEMAEAVPRHCAGGTPALPGGIIHT